MQIALAIPTFNAGVMWSDVIASIKHQTADFSVIIIDSGSTDSTVQEASDAGFNIYSIKSEEFNHAGTRQRLVELAGDVEVCVFLTQDAILTSSESITNLIKVFEDQTVGMAYGRQLPHKQAKLLERHARFYNYSDKSHLRSIKDQHELGFKAFFCSNSFAAYRKSVLLKVGGFPSGSIMGEDAIVAAKMLKAGYKKAYVADATVYHSHSYTLLEEFRRYFDTRVFHEQNKWMIKEFGKPTGEGFKFVRSEMKYILKNSPFAIVKSISSVFAKWLGYNIGRYYKRFPLFLLKKLSMHSFYWK